MMECINTHFVERNLDLVDVFPARWPHSSCCVKKSPSLFSK